MKRGGCFGGVARRDSIELVSPKTWYCDFDSTYEMAFGVVCFMASQLIQRTANN